MIKINAICTLTSRYTWTHKTLEKISWSVGFTNDAWIWIIFNLTLSTRGITLKSAFIGSISFFSHLWNHSEDTLNELANKSFLKISSLFYELQDTLWDKHRHLSRLQGRNLNLKHSTINYINNNLDPAT